MVIDGAGADEQLGGDFSVRGTVGRAAGDLSFLGGQLVARLGALSEELIEFLTLIAYKCLD